MLTLYDSYCPRSRRNVNGSCSSRLAYTVRLFVGQRTNMGHEAKSTTHRRSLYHFEPSLARSIMTCALRKSTAYRCAHTLIESFSYDVHNGCSMYAFHVQFASSSSNSRIRYCLSNVEERETQIQRKAERERWNMRVCLDWHPTLSLGSYT